jgi:L-cystine transport system substrate-binding protein
MTRRSSISDVICEKKIMKNSLLIKKTLGVVAGTVLALGLTACGKDATATTAPATSADNSATESTDATSADTAVESEATDESSEARTIKIVGKSSEYPLEFIDDSGQWDGYEIEVLRLIDEALPQYDFEYVEGNDQTSNYTGVSTGKYQVVLSNAFYTDERAQNYNLPANQSGASPLGLIQRTENADITSLDQAADAGQIFTPSLAGDGLTYQLEEYNRQHTDKQLQFEYSDPNSLWTDAIAFVAEGRYDTAIFPATYYEQLVTAEDGSYHQYADKLSFKATIPCPTYFVIAKEETELSDAVSEQLGILKDSGKLEEIAIKWYGFNPFDLDDELAK